MSYSHDDEFALCDSVSGRRMSAEIAGRVESVREIVGPKVANCACVAFYSCGHRFLPNSVTLAAPHAIAHTSAWGAAVTRRP